MFKRKRAMVAAGLIIATNLIMAQQSDVSTDVSRLAPLSSVVAVTAVKPLPEVMKQLVDQYARGEASRNQGFPLENIISDSVRTVPGLRHHVVVKWLDPLTEDLDVSAPRFGANADFICFFGDDWNSDWVDGAVGSGPAYSGDSQAGWIWVNHEYISNSTPTPTNAPNGQHRTFAEFLKKHGQLQGSVTSDTWSQEDVDTYIRWHKTQVGGSWFRIVQNPYTKEWSVDRTAEARRYDATSNTLTRIVGYTPQRPAKDDQGNTLPANVVVGITGDCSGGQTPWGTVITAEENVQGYYGDLETAWSSSNRFKPGEGFDPGSMITFNVEPGITDGQVFGSISDPNGRKDRDHYGFLVEIDPGEPGDLAYSSVKQGGNGKGHRKIGTMGRVRWENATVAVDDNFNLPANKPVVIYGANDRRSGRIYKFVSSEPFVPGMTKAEVRALLDEGDLFIGHFAGIDHRTGITMYDSTQEDGFGDAPSEATPGMGQWIHMSISNQTDTAPNAPALGPGTTVGQALQDVNWNGIGGFANDNYVLGAMFTAANKLGVAELNRPEDLEYNPNDWSGNPRVYIAFTNHTRPAANNQDGVLDDSTPSRQDPYGSIFALAEEDPSNPGASRTFKFFQVWKGFTPDNENDDARFAAADPDNLAIGKDGSVFFGTDGNAGSTGDTRADAIYYLDLDPAHKAGSPGIVEGTYGQAFRVVSAPGDAEATGPWFTPDMTTLFFNVQHPGEDFVATPSTWPQNRSERKPTPDRFVPFKTKD